MGVYKLRVGMMSLSVGYVGYGAAVMGYCGGWRCGEVNSIYE